VYVHISSIGSSVINLGHEPLEILERIFMQVSIICRWCITYKNFCVIMAKTNVMQNTIVTSYDDYFSLHTTAGVITLCNYK